MKSSVKEANLIKLGRYIFDESNMLLRIGKEEILLTKVEFLILRSLVLNKENIVRKEDLISTVWFNRENLGKSTLRVFISILRKILSKDPRIKIICHRSIGYRLTIKNPV